ncbi:hypothetical protein Pint_34551 [Pistacia integerrima]|uniref:Uncharacterized protein n=1 Tax=Pistacia integerrima TaxID=434235 RepID=A0ACC0X5B1_9ROSI|nr:hypothetical protein Pint_34551 [Pistacia integerrima]
MTSGKSTTLF